MTAITALLVDSYRELNAKKLFWVTMILSALVVAVFFVVGIDKARITLLGYHVTAEIPAMSWITPATFYKYLFTTLGVGFWLSWVGVILALVSTAGIFPDFLAGGSVDLYLSKPVSRLTLLATKYVAGLLFVAAQVTVFSFGCYLLLGFRGHSWQPAVFLSIPLVTLMFSYLFAVCALLGVVTRSTIASLMLTMLVWFAVWGVHKTEQILLFTTTAGQVHQEFVDKAVVTDQAKLDDAIKSPASTRPSVRKWGVARIETADEIRTRLDGEKLEQREMAGEKYRAHGIVYGVMTLLPKTAETTDLIDRTLIDKADRPPERDQIEQDEEGNNRRPAEFHEAAKRVQAVNESRSVGWVIGTSLGFEAVLLALAAFVFVRRDY